MDLIDATRRAARSYPGGVDAVALRMGKSASTLEKELRSAPGYKLGLADAVEIMAVCWDVKCEHALDLLNAQATSVGAMVVLLPDAACADTCTAGYVANLMREFSDVLASVGEAVADNKISPNELKKIEHNWAELMASGTKLMQVLASQVQASQALWAKGSR